MQPLVSICIPTFNRVDCLKQTIESIIHEPEFLDGRVEIVVSDNASTDMTHELCEQYINYPNFYYHRNTENVVDENFPIVLSKAHGKLRKLNNDTFVFRKDALKNLCKVVEKYDQSRPFVFLRNGHKNNNIELNFHDFVMDVGYWITWIGSFAIWEDECDHIENDILGCELCLWQVRKAYEIAYQKNSAVIYCSELGTSIAPPKKNISYGLYKVFYCNYMKLLNIYVEKGALNRKDIDSLEKELLFDFFPGWIIRYELNNTDLVYSKEENLKEAVFNQYKDKPYWNEFKKLYKKRLLIEKIKLFIKRIVEKYE